MLRYIADVEWINDLDFALKYGDRSSPRGMPVYEAMSYKSNVSMQAPIIVNQHRNLGYKFMAAEAAWIVGGQEDVASIAPYSKEISKFSDDGETFYGAYGPRIKGQVQSVVSALTNDKDTRQAVLTIWRPNPRPSKDIPCTVALQWLIRLNKLYCVATMRSSDLWLGHPYDIVNFSSVSFYILLHLRETYPELELGELYLTAGSKHVYERNAHDAAKIVQDYRNHGFVTSQIKTPFVSRRYGNPDDFVTHLWDAANSYKGMLSLLEE